MGGEGNAVEQIGGKGMPFRSTRIVVGKKRGFIVDTHGKKTIKRVHRQFGIDIKIGQTEKKFRRVAVESGFFLQFSQTSGFE